MAPAPPTLFDLLGDPTAAWPSDHVHEHPGVPLDGQADPTVWLAALNASVRVHDVRTGADADRVALQAQLTVDPTAGFLSYPTGWPFVIGSMPDVEFRVQPYPQSGRSVGMFISAGDSGVELVLEGLPVEIRLPPELVAPHPDLPGDPSGALVVEVGEFEAGRLDDLKVILRRGDVTSIFVHVRLTMTESYEFHLQPVVPISFGRCALSAIPCAAVHDFRLLPSPRLAREREEWLRHTVEPWLPSHTAAFDGLVAVRSVDVDEQAQGLKDVVQWLNGHARDTDPTADFVLDDLVVPFHGPFWLPVPRHLTAGIRRKVLDPASKEQVYAFEGAPVHLVITDDHRIAFNVESFFYRSQPSENLDKDLGLTFSAALVFGLDSAPQQALEVGLDEDYTIVTGYKRDFAPSTTGGPPVPGPGPKPKTNELLHWEIAGTIIADVMAIRAGFSLGRYLSGSSWPDSLLLTIDVFVSLPPTGKDTSTFRLRSLNGEKVAFAIEGLGWRLGSLHVEGLALPDGVVAYIANVALVIAELGLKAEDGASYLSFSGGLLVELPSGLKGGVTVRRLRFRVAGNQSRPSVKFDGFFLSARNRDGSVVFEGGGAYGQDGDDTKGGREFRFTATLTFDLGERKYTFGFDFLIGDRWGPDGRFDYLLVQAFFRATIGPLGAFELTGARVLYGRNLLPLLSPVDRESRELRYYRWYRENDPLTVPGDRRLAGWRPERDSWSFGIGASASLPALGKLVELTVFVLGLRGASEQGALVVGEVYALKNTKPLGFLALELDRRNDRYSLLIGVDARASSFVKDAPAWMDGIGTFTGTLFLSNDPSTVAIGRLADQSTWLQLRFDVDLFLKSSLVIGFCLELVEDGPKGFGLVVRVEGGIGVKGILRASYNAGISLAVLVFTTGSTDYSAVISIEVGFRIVLFGFLRIGVSATMDFRVVGAHPARGELSAALKLETPWFLPDYTLRIEFQFGELAPGELATAVAPLRSAGAVEPGAQRQLPTHMERFDPSWNGEGVAPVHSVVELQAPTRSEAERLANLAADAELRPVATDATIGVTFSVAVNDRLALGVGVASGLGDQQSGDLGLTYDLVGIAVRRRARFGTDLSWKPLEQRVELGPDFSDPGGVQLNGSFGPQILNKTWDTDLRVGGAVAPKKLLLNGVAPYEFTTRNPEGDEELVRRFPAWPCCQPPSEKDLEDRLHRLDWHGARAGEALDGARAWRFTGATSTLRFLRPAWTRPVVFTGLAPGTIVAAASFGAPGIVARADFDEDVAFCRVRLAWPRGTRATLVAFDGAGAVVGRMELDFGTDGFQVFVLGASGPIRRLELRGFRPGFGAAAASASPAAAITGSMLEVDEVAYVGLRDYLDLLVLEECDGSANGGYEGKGKLAFLPNHEYELQLTTRVTIDHPSTPPISADVDEFVYFRTKGLPGLNAVVRTGDELEPYVLGAYAGGRGGLVYREEPVTLAFSEGFLVAVPLEARDPGSADEHATLLRMQLVITPDVAAGAQTAFTVTAEDWVVAHRLSLPPPPRGDLPWRAVLSLSRSGPSAMVSVDPARERLATATQRAAVPCPVGDPRQVIGTVLVAPPQGSPDPENPSTELWTARSRFTAVVRVGGAGFVDRRPFVEGDERAFAVASVTGVPVWSVVDGELRAGIGGPSLALFGDPDWDHLTVVVGIAPGSAGAGVGFGLAQAEAAPRGLFAAVEVVGGSARLVVRRRDAGGATLVEVGTAELPADTGSGPVALEVTAFDDRLRASIGEATVEVDRGEIRAGRLCLTAEEGTAFRTLQVRGLDLYAFSFGVSGFRTFAEHVGSWSGRVDAIAPDTLGPGTTTATVAQLWGATAADIASVMAPQAPSAERERVFAAWVAGLGLPLKDAPAALELSAVVEVGQARALLIESPEPLDFIEEVAVEFVYRKLIGPGLPPRRPSGSSTAPSAPGRIRPLRDRLADLGAAPVQPVRSPLPPVDEAILDVEEVGDGLRLTLHPAFAGARELAVIAVPDSGPPQLYGGTVRPGIGPDAPCFLPAALVGPLPSHLPPDSELPAALAGAEPGMVLLATTDLVTLLGRRRRPPDEVDVPIAVRMLQNGDGRRALLIPTDAAPLESGRYRLTLRLSRRRWVTTEPPDDVNMYAREAMLSLEL